jgi:glycosyltransferase involved in cell wall biosynthesis
MTEALTRDFPVETGPKMTADVVPLLFANNYDMARARAGWKAGTYPGHHLFGTAQLGDPFSVVDLPYSSDDLLARITFHSRRKFGNLGQQVAAVGRRRKGSIVYGAMGAELRSLAALRAAGLFPAPIVGVFQPVPGGGPVARLALRGFDRAIAMSRSIRDSLLEGGMPADRITVLGWGPDLAFPGFADTGPAARDAAVVSTGKTGRDLNTLLEALAQTGLPGRVYGDRQQLQATAPIPPQVEIVPTFGAASPSSGPLTYEHTIADLRSAAVVAIPLLESRPLHGLTEVVDALACGRPMILTRAQYFDFDIEEIGCGWWVERGDVRGWIDCLTAAMSDRERLDRMGLAGRAWARENFNSELFADGVRSVLLEVAAAV